MLRHVKTPEGRPLVEGKKVTGFTNTEEATIKLTDIVPFLVEDELKAKGGIYTKAPDWEPYVVRDGLLITGQNPASSALAAQQLLDQLSSHANATFAAAPQSSAVTTASDIAHADWRAMTHPSLPQRVAEDTDAIALAGSYLLTRGSS